ncbi:hypothetical protein EVAR_3919_1 [Eumeta japonica]|uniref:Uncharacterized protein n=1 Tax=Eumeta variegata TaxID=151549 RepID=A0A4C1SR00_EUMVA|nr:hypothetical protein EVAR_3919_1 [Eumeta japonica]
MCARMGACCMYACAFSRAHALACSSSGGKGAFEPPKSTWSPPPMNTRNLREVTTALLTSWIELEYLEKGKWPDGGAREVMEKEEKTEVLLMEGDSKLSKSMRAVPLSSSYIISKTKLFVSPEKVELVAYLTHNLCLVSNAMSRHENDLEPNLVSCWRRAISERHYGARRKHGGRAVENFRGDALESNFI